jgi:hypothetical protein
MLHDGNFCMVTSDTGPTFKTLLSLSAHKNDRESCKYLYDKFSN